MDNNAAYFDFDVNAFAATSDWHHANGFCDPSGLPTQSALEVPPHNWYLPDTTAPRWPSTDSTGTSISGGSPGEWGSPQMMSLQLGARATHPGQQYNPIDSGMMDTPQITVGIVTAADRKAATKRRRQQQNRDAQRTFRQRRQGEFEKLGSELELEKQKVVTCQAEVERLTTELERLRKLLQAGNVSDKSADDDDDDARD
ncbi:hypothetical protein BP6252_09447 [Coleophoma cylindrospora]|uniref:BZIP domain-containing protein n=1 Tax=Coleophoma cylindrospora TaxID=1849047 RepID=A0A3D8R2A4_9HELO|nr:hypothetical protein BP6252_09447 [Coleophoma cylindrospora]